MDRQKQVRQETAAASPYDQRNCFLSKFTIAFFAGTTLLILFENKCTNIVNKYIKRFGECEQNKRRHQISSLHLSCLFFFCSFLVTEMVTGLPFCWPQHWKLVLPRFYIFSFRSRRKEVLLLSSKHCLWQVESLGFFQILEMSCDLENPHSKAPSSCTWNDTGKLPAQPPSHTRK